MVLQLVREAQHHQMLYLTWPDQEKLHCNFIEFEEEIDKL